MRSAIPLLEPDKDSPPLDSCGKILVCFYQPFTTMTFKSLLLLFTLFCSSVSFANPKAPIRLGVMAAGTLAWELAAMKNLGLLNNPDFSIETIPLANQQAGKIALQAGSVDMIVSDWIWVSSMRSDGNDYTFSPFSNSAGGLLVASNSPINSLADLKGKKLGIAGGELDKNWLLLQALGLKQGIDLNQSVEKIYAAPPLLNQQLSQGGLDAVLTYWQFAARLEAQGYRQLLSGEEIILQLGIQESVPSLGYVFKQSFAQQQPFALASFFTASKSARNSLCSVDSEWQKIISLTETDDQASQQKIRQRYCQGQVKHWGSAEQRAAATLYGLLSKLSDNKLTGKSPTIETGTFWSAE